MATKSKENLTLRTAHTCVHITDHNCCTQNAIQCRMVLITFPLIPWTIIIAQMLYTGRQGQQSVWKGQQYYTKFGITRMWANAQRDGRPAKHMWRPLFNAAKYG